MIFLQNEKTMPFHGKIISLANFSAGLECEITMENFDNASVKKEANVYFGGKVTSRQITLPNGDVKTLGIMLAGEYEFGTDAPELMEVTAGSAEIRLDGESEFTTYTAGQSFNVPGNSKFFLKVGDIFDYVCSFLK